MTETITTVLVTCDCCGKEINRTRWEETTGYLKLNLHQSSCNPLNKYDTKNHQNCTVELEDICSSCTHKLSEDMVKLLDKYIRRKVHVIIST